jgi:hypothetical protein
MQPLLIQALALMLMTTFTLVSSFYTSYMVLAHRDISHLSTLRFTNWGEGEGERGGGGRGGGYFQHCGGENTKQAAIVLVSC